jgi:AraC-like DNA-binding protein
MLTTQTVDFSTYPQEDRFGCWHDFVSQASAPQLVTSDHRDNFNAWTRVMPLGPVLLTLFRYPSLHTRRTPALIRRGDPCIYQMALPLTGDSVITQARQESQLRPAADFTVLDSSRPHEASHSAERRGELARSLTVIVPHDVVPLPRPTVERLFAGRIASREGMGALLARDLLHIANHPDEFREVDAGYLGRRIIDLIAVTFCQRLGDTDALPGDVKRRAIRTKIDAFIDAHLGDPGLNAHAIAAAHHLVVREVHRIFQGGRTVSEEIKRRRLERCRRDLLDPGLAALPIYAIAARHGLLDKAYFSREFKAAYGAPPRDFRAQALHRHDRLLTQHPQSRFGLR